MIVFVFTVANSRLELCMLDYWNSRQIGLGKLMLLNIRRRSITYGKTHSS
jgi:hypothetical protein